MIQEFLEIDYKLFELINSSLSNPVFDLVLPLLRNEWLWIPLYIIIIYGLFKFNTKKIFAISFLTLILSVTLADRISAGVFKPYFKRERPCYDELLKDQIVLRKDGCGGRFGFVSSHAANHFALAVLFIHFFRKKYKWVSWASFLWAFLISFSQVYVGVHFPGDVFFGAILGVFCAQIALILNKIIIKRIE